MRPPLALRSCVLCHDDPDPWRPTASGAEAPGILGPVSGGQYYHVAIPAKPTRPCNQHAMERALPIAAHAPRLPRCYPCPNCPDPYWLPTRTFYYACWQTAGNRTPAVASPRVATSTFLCTCREQKAAEVERDLAARGIKADTLGGLAAGGGPVALRHSCTVVAFQKS